MKPRCHLLAGAPLVAVRRVSKCAVQHPHADRRRGALLRRCHRQPIPFSPDFTVDLAATYKLYTSLGKFDLTLSDYYSASYFTEADNFIRQGSYDYLNTAVTWSTEKDRCSVKLWANNLLDKAVVTQGATLATGYIFSNSNPPRTYGVTLRYQF